MVHPHDDSIENPIFGDNISNYHGYIYIYI